MNISVASMCIVNSAAVNIGVHVSFRIMVSSWYMPKSGIAGLYGNYIFSFLRNLHAVLQFTFPPTTVGGFPFLHTLSSISRL